MSWENECPESGEFFFHGRLWQKFSLKVDNSAQNWLSPHVISHFLIDQPRTSALGAAVELLFCLPPVWESSATNLGKFRHQFGKVPPPIWDFHSTVFLSWISFIFVSYLFSSAFLSSTSLGKFFNQFGIFTQMYFSVGFLSCLFSSALAASQSSQRDKDDERLSFAPQPT